MFAAVTRGASMLWKGVDNLSRHGGSITRGVGRRALTGLENTLNKESESENKSQASDSALSGGGSSINTAGTLPLIGWIRLIFNNPTIGIPVFVIALLVGVMLYALFGNDASSVVSLPSSYDPGI